MQPTTIRLAVDDGDIVHQVVTYTSQYGGFRANYQKFSLFTNGKTAMILDAVWTEPQTCEREAVAFWEQATPWRAPS